MMILIGKGTRAKIFVLVALVFMGLQSCSSSGSGERSESPATPFSDPTDAQTLRGALLTDASRSETWECVLSEGNTRLSYRLLADGTGTETDKSNPNVQSGFTWQATGATTMMTVVNDTGVQNNFSNILFSGPDSMSLVFAESLNLTCERSSNEPTPPATPAGNNSLSYGGVEYPLTHGFEEAFSFRPTQRNDTHRTSQFAVANADFTSTTIFGNGLSPTFLIWRPTGASVWLRAKLHAPGGDRFSSATFTYEPNTTDDDGPLVAGRFFFNDGRFGVDINENGSIDSEDNEFIDITAGTISVERLVGNNARMSFDVTLANGVNTNGNFEGLFVLFDHELSP